MMSSLSPGGALSASTGVTKRYGYCRFVSAKSSRRLRTGATRYYAIFMMRGRATGACSIIQRFPKAASSYGAVFATGTTLADLNLVIYLPAGSSELAAELGEVVQVERVADKRHRLPRDDARACRAGVERVAHEAHLALVTLAALADRI